MPQDKVGMCKEAPGRSPSYSKGAGAKKNQHHVTEARQNKHSTGHPKIKWACAKRLQEEALYITKGRSRRTEVA